MKVNYVELFKQLKRQYGSYDKVIIYLITKYRFRLELFKDKVSKAAKIYQPENSDYTRFSFCLEKEAIWGYLDNLKDITGMSISMMIRIMLEWEFFSNGIQMVKNTVQLSGGKYPELIDRIWFRFWEWIMLQMFQGIVIQGIEVTKYISLFSNTFYIDNIFYFR